LIHRFVRELPDWSLSRGQVDQLASTTVLTAFAGLLMAVAELMMTIVAVLQIQADVLRWGIGGHIVGLGYILIPLRSVGWA